MSAGQYTGQVDRVGDLEGLYVVFESSVQGPGKKRYGAALIPDNLAGGFKEGDKVHGNVEVATGELTLICHQS